MPQRIGGGFRLGETLFSPLQHLRESSLRLPHRHTSESFLRQIESAHLRVKFFPDFIQGLGIAIIEPRLMQNGLRRCC